jgi:Do/DeqQ family serine protease
MSLRIARAALAASILFAFAGAGFAAYAVLTRPADRGRTSAPAPIATADALQAAFVSVAERVRPAVVHIGTLQVARGRRPPMIPGPKGDDPFFKDFFDQFFGRSGPGRREEFQTPGLGSGVIIDKRGYVLTNFHVVRGADAVTVRLADKQEFRGRIIGSDAKTDLAIIKFDPPADVRVATLGNSDTLRVGEWAIAIGNPFGLDQTVTVGVVSATGRADVGIATYENFIQTDASINPGNSGGPLVNLRGEVIGINTAIVATGQGIGFAIPANMVKRVTAQLIDRGRVQRGWIGVALQPMSAELAQALGLADSRGAIVARVYPSSPAEAAGLAQNDVIVGFDGAAVEDYHHLQRLSSDAEVGRTVALDVVRKREKKTFQLKVAEAPDTGPGADPKPRERQ